MNTLLLPHHNTLSRHTCELIDGYYGNSHHSTRKNHKRRTNTILKYFCGEFKIKKLTDIKIEMRLAHIDYMLAQLDAKKLSINSIHNYISSFNTVLFLEFRNNHLHIDASDYFPPRSTIRKKAPSSMDIENVLAARHKLSMNGHPVFGLYLAVMRGLGLRIRETVMQDYRRLLDSLDEQGTVKVEEGSKGSVAKFTVRRVPLPTWLLSILFELAERQGDRRNLIPADLTRDQFISAFTYQYNRVRHDFGLANPHDFRAAAACDWYEQLTGIPAPVLTEHRVSRAEDEKARLKISHRLGHHRISVCTYYIGSKRGYK